MFSALVLSHFQERDSLVPLEECATYAKTKSLAGPYVWWIRPGERSSDLCLTSSTPVQVHGPVAYEGIHKITS